MICRTKHPKNQWHKDLTRSLFGLSVFLLCLTSSQLLADSLLLSGQATLSLQRDVQSQSLLNESSLSYLPALSAELYSQPGFSIDADLSLLMWVSRTETQTDSEFNLYRLYSQINFDRSDLRIGLQQINFGPAFMLRSLRWFDQLDANDPLARTAAVTALRYRYFFDNNANLWLWTLAGNAQPKGTEAIATSENTLEGGGRYQWPLLGGEVAITAHLRQTDLAGFTAVNEGKPLIEKRLGLDGRWDPLMGLWYEYMLVDQGLSTEDAKNWYESLTLGADYTFGIGNGLYLMTEHQIKQSSDQLFSFNEIQNISAVQLNYPLNIFDSISGVVYQDWSTEISTQRFTWQQAYDALLFSVSMAKTSGEGAEFISIDGKRIELMLTLNH